MIKSPESLDSHIEHLMEVSYLSGYFDSEGCISIRSKPPLSLDVKVIVATTYPANISRFADFFDGSFVPLNRRTATNKQVYSTTIRRNSLASFLHTCIPYLTEKRDQAKLLLKWLAFKKMHKANPTSQVLRRAFYKKLCNKAVEFKNLTYEQAV